MSKEETGGRRKPKIRPPIPMTDKLKAKMATRRVAKLRRKLVEVTALYYTADSMAGYEEESLYYATIMNKLKRLLK